MMAFYTEFTESGQKRFHPTPELREVLEQDRITEKDLQQFRSSNRVQQLMSKILQDRGFERDFGKREWVRVAPDVMKPAKKSAISHMADTFNMLFSNPIAELAVKTKGLQAALDAQAPKEDHPPKKVSVAEKVQVAVCDFVKQVGQHPNKLWISGTEWHELAKDTFMSNKAPFAGIIYQGMKVELMAPGTELFVGIAAGEKSGKAQMLEKFMEGEQLLQPYHKAILKTLAMEDKAPAAPEAAPEPAPERKRIVPPSQLKRKLAL